MERACDVTLSRQTRCNLLSSATITNLEVLRSLTGDYSPLRCFLTDDTSKTLCVHNLNSNTGHEDFLAIDEIMDTNNVTHCCFALGLSRRENTEF